MSLLAAVNVWAGRESGRPPGEAGLGPVVGGAGAGLRAGLERVSVTSSLCCNWDQVTGSAGKAMAAQFTLVLCS